MLKIPQNALKCNQTITIKIEKCKNTNLPCILSSLFTGISVFLPEIFIISADELARLPNYTCFNDLSWVCIYFYEETFPVCAYYKVQPRMIY
jgi:hypothetical protein